MKTTKRIAICVFTKPARAGEVKTRLGPAVGLAGAAELSRAFFDDTWSSVASLSWAHPLVACTEPMVFEDGREVWIQVEGDLGKKQEYILRRALRTFPAALVIGSDIPGLPSRILDSARLGLASADVVLGPSSDGGFYLIGTKRFPHGLLSEIQWSKPNTFCQVLSRVRRTRMRIHILQPWSDVDTPEDLARLQSLIEAGSIVAPHTAEILRRAGRRFPNNQGTIALTANIAGPGATDNRYELPRSGDIPEHEASRAAG